MPDVIWFRGDGGPTVGLGHLARLAALAEEAATRGAHCRFVVNDDDDAQAFLQNRGWPDVFTAPTSLKDEINFLLGRVPPAPLVIDLRGKDPAFYRALRDAGVRTCALDDMGEDIAADILVNGSLPAAWRNYPRDHAARKLLLGPLFIPLRRGFSTEPPPPQDVGRTHLLITFGGVDADDFTAAALTALGDLPPLPVDVVLGPAYPHGERTTVLCARSRYAVTVHAPARDMLTLYDRARVALAAGGITLYELAARGVPAVTVPHIAREEAECEAFAAAGAVLTFPKSELRPGGEVPRALTALWQDGETRARMAAAGRAIVDGAGARRVMDAVMDLVRG